MRSPDRLDEFYYRLKEIHKKNVPDWRFGQLISNFIQWLCYYKKIDPFFPEEDRMLKLFEEYFEEDKEARIKNARYNNNAVR